MPISDTHFGSIASSKRKSIGSCKMVGMSGKFVAAGMEDNVDLVMVGEEPMRLPDRFETTYYLLSLYNRAVGIFNAIAPRSSAFTDKRKI